MDSHSNRITQCAADMGSSQVMSDLVALVEDVFEVLQRERDLTPANDAVTSMIERLKSQLRLHYEPEEIGEVLNNERIRSFHGELLAKLSAAESETELYDSRTLCATNYSGLQLITGLPYWGIYEALVGQELAILRNYIGRDLAGMKVVFVGSGPMPLSAILIHLYSNAEVTCLEINPAAFEASRTLLERLGLQDRVTVRQVNGDAFDYGDYPIIFVASLVTDKAHVLEQIRCKQPDALVAVRTAEGMRQLMYETLDERLLKSQGWQILGRTTPQENLVINSTLFMQFTLHSTPT
ncbi:hypothetical protein FHS18_003576 [Paenibacillus phyllosphaerae]|uniref:Nicotianamine synthase n=1 Tax=Paenibacillus phyllosphaerae TaxID=274593 RepID=A0A7W5FNT6_9BACL|nr:nicotianamine synthase family protein [Paenibacillus phyllosphaerae]MBB3111508.1 hypothetical protein [Paenibacillus phyllosphaerae]